ncbi:MAG: AraC family transcriptional regulator [Bacteroidota bacterium]
MHSDIAFRLIKPHHSLSEFVESFWLLENRSEGDKELVILPDGRIDLTFSKSATQPFQIILSGIETKPDKALLKAKTRMFAVSFKLLSTEYIFGHTISDFVNSAKQLPPDFWNFSEEDLADFDLFCSKASQQLYELLPKDYDNRKKKLFDLIYETHGTVTVKELSEKVSWSSRQINRYFNHQFGLPLKAYCNILRFRASFHHIKDGQLYPQQNFADQSHFIKEIRKLSGVSPKELKLNRNDRFIQLSTLLPD